ncbi:MAG: glutamyl-tRNA reductase [Candidatus Omnitrophica bacterium]|nr:glutamyl-tRNA reductase [Candidatus Omnitrophota bacterium]
MVLQLLGINHKTAPVQIREKVSFSDNILSEALLALKTYDSIEENLILSTCNRTEIYAVVKEASKGLRSLKIFISDFHKILQDEIHRYFYFFSGIEVARHLFRVISSLDSQILGETQIFGQVKQAYFKAKECKTIGKNLICLFEEAIKVGKRVRKETNIGEGAVSISSVAVELTKKIFEDLKEKNALIIGAGKVGEITVKNFYSRGINSVFVANRTYEKAETIASKFGGKAIKFEHIFEALSEMDIVISSVSSPHFILSKDQIELIMEKRKFKPLFFIDLGVPRNIDPKINEIRNVYLYDIDDLNLVRDKNIKKRKIEAKKADKILEECVLRYAKKNNCWCQGK